MVAEKLVSEMERMEEMAVIFKRFGDEKSTLLDQYERLSFEVQLNKAILGRSMSEPAVARRQEPVAKKPEKQGRRSRGSGFQKVMRRLFSPILGKRGARKDGAPAPIDPVYLKPFSRSLRV